MTVELRPYIEGLRARREAERRAAEERAATANVVARRCAEHLRGRFGVTRVILFGSLARGEFHSTSDIDLAVEGLPPDQLFRAGADLAKIAGEIEGRRGCAPRSETRASSCHDPDCQPRVGAGGFELDWSRLMPLVARVGPTLGNARTEIEGFLEFLDLAARTM